MVGLPYTHTHIDHSSTTNEPKFTLNGCYAFIHQFKIVCRTYFLPAHTSIHVRFVQKPVEICVKPSSSFFCWPVLNWTLLMLWWRNHTVFKSGSKQTMFLCEFFICRLHDIDGFVLFSVSRALKHANTLSSKAKRVVPTISNEIHSLSLSHHRNSFVVYFFSSSALSTSTACWTQANSSVFLSNIAGERDKLKNWTKVTTFICISRIWCIRITYRWDDDGECDIKLCRIIHFSCLHALHQADGLAAICHERLIDKMISFHLPLRFRNIRQNKHTYSLHIPNGEYTSEHCIAVYISLTSWTFEHRRCNEYAIWQFKHFILRTMNNAQLNIRYLYTYFF